MRIKSISDIPRLARHVVTHGPRAGVSRLRAALQPRRTDGHVLIMHNGRSGSTLLGDMLDQHPSIFWDGETFEKLVHRTAQAEEVSIESLYGRYLLDDGVAEVARRMRARAGNRRFGTEIQDYHLDMMGTDLGSYIEKLKPMGFDTFVYLDRNYMRKIVSGLVAVERKAFHVTAKQKVKNLKITIDPERSFIGHTHKSVLSTLNRYKTFEANMSKALAGDDVLRLTYERDIQDGPVMASDKICDFMGLPRHAPEIKFGKTTAFPLEDIVENYDEIRAIVEPTEFRVHLDVT